MTGFLYVPSLLSATHTFETVIVQLEKSKKFESVSLNHLGT